MLVELIRVYEIKKCENTPEKVKLLQKGLRVVSDKPMIVKFKRRGGERRKSFKLFNANPDKVFFIRW